MATGIDKGVLDDINQVLLCQICLNPMINRKARKLSCLHTFCQVCLEKILTRKPGREIMCPICRLDTDLPTGQVSDLPLNFNIDQTNQLVKTLVRTALCSKCCNKNEHIPATNICITCRRQMCNTCRKQHDRLPGFIAHQMEQLEHDVTGDSEELCKTHKSTFCLFCSKCKVFLCSQCMTEDVHDSHTDDIQSLDVAMAEIQTSFSDRKRGVVKHLDFVKEKIEVKSRQLEHLASVKKDIIQTMDSLKSNIDKSGNDLIKELEENYIAKIEQRKAHLTDIVKSGESSLKSIEDFEVNTTIRLLGNSDSLIKETSEFDQRISELKNKVEIAMVKFTKQLQVSAIGKFEKTDLKLVVREPDRRDLLTSDNLIKLSKQLRHPAAAKPTLVESYIMSSVAVDPYSDVATLGDSSAVFIGESDDEIGLLRINHQGDRVSRYKPDGGDEIKSISAFNKTIVCLFGKESKYQELAVDHKEIYLTKLHVTPGIKADGVCVDCSGNIILYDKKTVTKLDSRDNIVWQKTVTGTCNRIRSGLLDNKKMQCYLLNYSSARKTEIWNEDGEVIGRLKYPPHQHPLVVGDMTVSHRGTFIVTQRCRACYLGRTVTEYGPDGSFIRHLLTQEDGVHRPYMVSCDQQGYIWFTDTWWGKIHIYNDHDRSFRINYPHTFFSNS